MSYRKLCGLGIVGALTLAVSSQAKAMTLADLTRADGSSNGATITQGDKVYSGFTYQSSSLTPGGIALPAGSVTISNVASPKFGLVFTAGWNTVLGAGMMDSVIGYTVTVTGNTGASIVGSGLDFGGLSSVGNGLAFVGETLRDNTAGKDYQMQVTFDKTGPLPDLLHDTVAITPGTRSLSVIKDITVTINPLTPPSFAGVSWVDNTFTQGFGPLPPVPEPMSLALIPLALVGLGLRRKLA